jgi:hypothetical protein
VEHSSRSQRAEVLPTSGAEAGPRGDSKEAAENPSPPDRGASTSSIARFADECRERAAAGEELLAEIPSAVLAADPEEAEDWHRAISGLRDTLDQLVEAAYEAMRESTREREEADRLGIELRT